MTHSHFELIDHETQSDLRKTEEHHIITEIEYMLDKGMNIHEFEGYTCFVFSKYTNAVKGIFKATISIKRAKK